MLYPNTVDCTNCASIIQLLEDIECSVLYYSKRMYNNIIFSLNKPINYSVLIDLFSYRRILMYKQINPNYASEYTIEMIASKIKLLKNK